MLFYYLSSGIKTCGNTNHWQCEHTEGMGVEVLSGWIQQLESWHLKSRKTAFRFLVYNSFLHRKLTGFSITHTHATASSSSEVMAQKTRFSPPCYLKSNQFLFGSSETHASAWAQLTSYAQAHTLQRVGWVETRFSAREGKNWGWYLQNRQVCMQLEAVCLPNVSVNYLNSHHTSRCYWWKNQRE